MSSLYRIGSLKAIVDHNNDGIYDSEDAIVDCNDQECNAPQPSPLSELEKRHFDELAKQLGFEVDKLGYPLSDLSFAVNRTLLEAYANHGEFQKIREVLPRLENFAAEQGIPFDPGWAENVMVRGALGYIQRSAICRYRDDPKADIRRFNQWSAEMLSIHRFLGIPFDFARWQAKYLNAHPCSPVF